MEEEEGHVRELTALDATDWCYRGEGAANIVLAYQGSDPLLMGKVLRLKKVLVGEVVKTTKPVCKSGKPVLTEEEQKLWANWPSVAKATSSESLIQAYARDVMSPLLGSELVDPGILVQVSREFLENVAHSVHHARPLSRVVATQIDTRSSKALLISDHSLFSPLAGSDPGKSSVSSISVEIKPKCGFLPNSDLIAVQNSVKKSVSRFTMHQVLKLSEGQVKVLSQYSPLDLFSENLERINQAVHSLFKIPQNNLRVFVGGSIIDPIISDSNPDCANWQALNEALQSCLLCESQAEGVEVLKELVVQSLYETNALRNLLAAQKLDTFDIEGAILAYRKILDGQPIDHSKGSTLETVEDSKNQQPGSKSADSLDGMSLSECLQIVRNYLIAATAKDCSLMLTFQQVLDPEANNGSSKYVALISISKTRYPFGLKMNFLDLDLKPLRKMPHYFLMDQEIVTTYLAAVQSEVHHESHS